MSNNTESTPEASGAAAPVAEALGACALTTGNEMDETNRLLEEAEKLANKVKRGEGGAQGEGLSEETKAKIEEMKERAMAAISKLRSTQDGLSQYQGELRGWINEQVMLENQMLEALENTRRMRARIRDEEERIAALKEQYEVMEPEQEGDGRQV